MTKGAELPLNMMVILILAVIVLVSLLILHEKTYGPGANSLVLEATKSEACRRVVNMGCDDEPKTFSVSNFDADKDGKNDAGSAWVVGNCGSSNTAIVNDNFMTLCECQYGTADPTACKKLCGCE